MVHWDLKVLVNMKKWRHKVINKRRQLFGGRLPLQPCFSGDAGRYEFKGDVQYPCYCEEYE
jgi:hypothetical protein